MFLDDAFKNLRGAFGIPGSLGIDDGNGAFHADAQAVGLGSHDAAFFAEPQFLESIFEVGPGFNARLFVAAFCDGLIAAEHDMAVIVLQTKRDGFADKGIFISDGRGDIIHAEYPTFVMA